MDQAHFVDTLKDSLRNQGFQFESTKTHDQKWSLCSPVCEIHILFERFEDGFNIEVCEPDSQQDPMSILLLRFLANADATDIEYDDESPEFYGVLFSRYFSDLLNGTFSIRSRYEDAKDAFFDLLFDAQSLPEDDVIKKKISNFDISWMELMGWLPDWIRCRRIRQLRLH